jgi:hypothetical protein
MIDDNRQPAGQPQSTYRVYLFIIRPCRYGRLDPRLESKENYTRLRARSTRHVGRCALLAYER